MPASGSLGSREHSNERDGRDGERRGGSVSPGGSAFKMRRAAVLVTRCKTCTPLIETLGGYSFKCSAWSLLGAGGQSHPSEEQSSG